MNKEDYRITTYCDSLDSIKKKKESLLKKIRESHETAIDLYKIVKKEEFRNDYFKVYNYKCAYCGAAMKNLSAIEMEVDHFINKASFTIKKNSGVLENLVSSCYVCNRKKSAFKIEGKYEKILYPDEESIKKVFYRDDDYGIKISPTYSNDEVILSFYEQLSLGSEFRKLDFLLVNIDGLIKDPRAIKIKTALESIKCKILEKRNIIKP
ncbi:HNH endonuclease [Cetobacterium sp.]|uniref:HNH endonuclease n=1 Tax=Cetobacterium sp. TaxID=2071632 RepID=UPI003EE570E7